MATIQTLTRVFRIGATTLADVDPSLSPEEVIRLYERSYPMLRHATLSGPTIEGTTAVYTVEKPPAQTKGANTDTDIEAALAALEAVAVAPEPAADARWQAIHARLLSASAPAAVDPFLIPMA